ncbi:MAG: hypothetical protein UHX00_05210 [Caryophanon sp.]|nr:hypothetical protein [Caryophanon sp.]
MYADTNLQFKHTNPLFAFDKLEAMRTTEFKIPCTPKNDRVFELARIPAYDGIGMRRAFSAQLQDGAIVENCSLYVSSFDGKDYKVIFTTGDFLGLAVLKNAGKIKNIPLVRQVLEPLYNDITAAGVAPSDEKTNIFAQVRYKAGDGIMIPSVNLHNVLGIALQALGVSYSLPTETQYVRCIPSDLEVLEKRSATLTVTTNSMLPDGSAWIVVYSPSANLEVEPIIEAPAAGARVSRVENNSWYIGTIRQYYAYQEIEIWFPQTWNDNHFIGRFLDGSGVPSHSLNGIGRFVFFGDRSFDENGVVSGESLRKRSVTIEQGTSFCIIDKSYFINTETEKGWKPTNISCSFLIEGKDVTIGGRVRLIDNIPDFTAVEALKAIAAMSGKMLNYTNDVGVYFDDLTIGAWDHVVLDNSIIKVGELKRTFADYQQRNLVQFNSPKETPESARISIAYTIDNVNLDAKKDLSTIPFSEGLEDGIYMGRGVLYAENGNEAVGDADTGGYYMSRVQLHKNTSLQTLCDAATQIDVQVRMTREQYMTLSPSTLIQIRGTRYVWTNKQWQKGVTKLTLAKI